MASAKSFAAGTDQQCVRLKSTKEEMGFAIGRTSLAIAAVTDVRLALTLLTALGEPGEKPGSSGSAFRQG